jgi:hypothetical protein
VTSLYSELGRAMHLHAVTGEYFEKGCACGSDTVYCLGRNYGQFGYCILSGAELRTVPFPLRNKKLFTSYFPRCGPVAQSV